MSGWSSHTYRDLASTLSPPAVSQYLSAHDWRLDARDEGVREVWSLTGEKGPLGRVMLPLATDYADFPDRFGDTLRALALIYGWDPAQLAERIAAARADLFFVRLDQETIDGTIPFRQAEAILDGLFRMMRAAATTADDPTHPHRGRRSATVTDFLEEDIRLGHTKRGSFVFTVVTRLGDPPPPGDGSPSATFPRRVMTTLAEGLEATRRLALTWDEQVLDHAGRLGLSAGLVEALADVLAADVNGRRRNVHIPLGGADYDVAIVAHRTKQPLVATGDLTFERNAWRLGGDVVVDAGFVDLNG